MKQERTLCELNEDSHGNMWWQPTASRPCCNVCYYYKDRECAEPMVCKNEFRPRSPESHVCNSFYSIDEMKESLKHCPKCDSTNICKHEYQGRNTKCNDCGHIWVII